MTILELFVSEKADADLARMDSSLRRLFIKHLEKIEGMPPRRHMRFGVPFNVEDVTKQARLVYQVDSNLIIVVRCFSMHKDYETWYKSFR